MEKRQEKSLFQQNLQIHQRKSLVLLSNPMTKKLAYYNLKLKIKTEVQLI